MGELFSVEAFPFLAKAILFKTGLEPTTISVVLPPKNPTNTNFMRIEYVSFSFLEVGVPQYRLDENMVLHYRKNCTESNCGIPSEHSIKLNLYGDDGLPVERFYLMGYNDYGITPADCLANDPPSREPAAA